MRCNIDRNDNSEDNIYPIEISNIYVYIIGLHNPSCVPVPGLTLSNIKYMYVILHLSSAQKLLKTAQLL